MSILANRQINNFCFVQYLSLMFFSIETNNDTIIIKVNQTPKCALCFFFYYVINYFHVKNKNSFLQKFFAFPGNFLFQAANFVKMKFYLIQVLSTRLKLVLK